jgi:hypothetical protein
MKTGIESKTRTDLRKYVAIGAGFANPVTTAAINNNVISFPSLRLLSMRISFLLNKISHSIFWWHDKEFMKKERRGVSSRWKLDAHCFKKWNPMKLALEAINFISSHKQAIKQNNI